MADGSFSDLPADLHNSLRSAWVDEARPASALLGISAQREEAEPVIAISSLHTPIHESISSEYTKQLEIRDKAILAFRHDLAAGRFGKEEGKEKIMDGLLERHFDTNLLPLNAATLQALTLDTAARHSTYCSSLFSVWSERLRRTGTEKPKLEISWPPDWKDKNIDFGEDMHDVDLTVTGYVKGTLGAKAKNCQIKLDDFKGPLLRNAVDCSVVAQAIDGPIMNSAEACAVRCKELNAGHITLGKGCVLKAREVKCSTISAERIYKSKSAGVPAKPCSVIIGRLTGTIKPGEDWVVTIAEVAEPPRPARAAPSFSTYSSSEYHSPNKINPNEEHSPYIIQQPEKQNLEIDSPLFMINAIKKARERRLYDKEESYNTEQSGIYLGPLPEETYNKIETSLDHLIYPENPEKY